MNDPSAAPKARVTSVAFYHDRLGRVTILGTGIDGTIRRISTTYDVLGRKSKITSWDHPNVNSGNVVNDVEFAYNTFGQLVADFQSHDEEVDTSTTPCVQYSFADGIANTTRPASITCPDGRVLDFSYGSSGSMPDATSRIDAIIDGMQTLVQYSYLGVKTFVAAGFPEPNTQWTMVNLSGINDPDTGDIYTGFDRFGRVKDHRWYNNGTSTDLDRIQHGDDRAGNRLWRQNTVATANGAAFDELYCYDGVNRLKEMQRGTLNGTQSAILSPVLAECWSLDSTANWSGYRHGTAPGNWSLVQQRSINQVNEIVSFTNTVGAAWAAPVYDPTGNMTTFPKASDPTTAQSAVYDAWNRLVKVSENSQTVAQYQYDGVNRRTLQQTYSSGVLTETRHFYYTTPSQWQVIEERVGATTAADRQYVWGLRYIDDLVLRDRDNQASLPTDQGGRTANAIAESSSLGERLYALQDANWNVTALVDTTGAVQERYAYFAYGMPTFLSASFGARSVSNYDWEVLYCGYRHDARTGLFHVRHRVYHPTLGGWVQRDPIQFKNQNDNAYSYDSINSVDPFGLVTISLTPKPIPGNNGFFPGGMYHPVHNTDLRNLAPPGFVVYGQTTPTVKIVCVCVASATSDSRRNLKCYADLDTRIDIDLMVINNRYPGGVYEHEAQHVRCLRHLFTTEALLHCGRRKVSIIQSASAMQQQKRLCPRQCVFGIGSLETKNFMSMTAALLRALHCSPPHHGDSFP